MIITMIEDFEGYLNNEGLDGIGGWSQENGLLQAYDHGGSRVGRLHIDEETTASCDKSFDAVEMLGCIFSVDVETYNAPTNGILIVTLYGGTKTDTFTFRLSDFSSKKTLYLPTTIAECNRVDFSLTIDGATLLPEMDLFLDNIAFINREYTAVEKFDSSEYILTQYREQ